MDWSTLSEITHTVSKPIQEILKSRKVKDIEKFLNPKVSYLYDEAYDPFKLKDMELAVARIATAIKDDELILVAGDYDADGVTSTSVLVIGLEELGGDIDYDIPNRTDGYGLSKDMVDEAHNNGVTLIVTCDNGIAAIEAIEHAKSLGIDVVVTDHHEPQEKLPSALAIVNPKQEDCPYPTKELAGCGVAFKLLQALNVFMNGDIRKAEKYLDITCIGTIADVMDLVGENRLIVKYGLERLSITERQGLVSLFKRIGLGDKESITPKDIGWSVGPVLNAIGRLYHAGDAVEMLITKSKRQAWRLAKRLDAVNLERQVLTEQWSKKIIDHIDNDEALLNESIMIIPYDEEIPEGLVGLIAGKLKERYSRPVILLVEDHNDPTKYKGSGRSIPAYNMFEEVLKNKSLLLTFGGHAAACGISLKKTNVKAFQKALNDNFDIDESELIPKLFIDYEIEPELVTLEFVEDLQRMEPFGKGNEKPLFMLRDVFVQYPKAIGSKQNHLKFLGQANEENIDMIGWSMHEKWVALGKPRAVDVAFYPGINEWNGKTKVQLEMRDIRLCEE